MPCSQLHYDRGITLKRVLLSREKFRYLLIQHPYYFHSFCALVLLTVFNSKSHRDVKKNVSNLHRD